MVEPRWVVEMCEVSGCGCVPSASRRFEHCVSVVSGTSRGNVVCGGVMGEKD